MIKGNKMIAITLRFFTNDIKVERKGKQSICCWTNGTIGIQKNEEKGLKYLKNIPFNHFSDIVPLIEEIFSKNRIIPCLSGRKPRAMHPNRKEYLVK